MKDRHGFGFLGALPLVFLLAFIASGCVTSSAHTEKSDDLLALVADHTANNSETLAQLKPEDAKAVHLANQARETATKTAKHADEDPTPSGLRVGVQVAKGVLEHPASGPVGIALTLAGSVFMARKKKSVISSLVDDLTNEPDKKRCQALRKGII